MRAGYKMTKLGEIPIDWEVKELGELSNFRRGSFPQPYGLDKWYDDINGYPFVQVYDVGNRFKLKDVTKRKISSEAAKQSVLVEKGTLIITIQGSIGRMAITQYEAYVDRTLLIFQSFIEPIDKYYFMYIVFQLFEVEKKRAHGSTIKTITKQQLSHFEIPLPPLQEQKKIAKILSTVDEKIDLTQSKIEATQALKKGLMQQLLTKGIGHSEFKKSKLGEIPKDWEVVNGNEISILITKGASPKWQGFDYQNEGMLFVTSENVRDGRLDILTPKFLPIEFNQKVKKSQLRNNDILINIVGASIGRCCLYSSNYTYANINQAICLLRVKSDVLPQFIAYYLQGDETIKRLLGSQNGSARQNLSLSDMRKFKFLLPPLQEQKKIAEILSKADEKLDLLKEKKQAYQAMKKGLMQQLLTGQVRVKA